jgi:undecaprenyl diphosphate synthase
MNSSVASSPLDNEEIYTIDELKRIKEKGIPSHVAIIMDGNRRWAKQKDIPCLVGHWKGADALTNIVKAASHIGIRTLTVFAFSTENWRRSEDEIETLMNLIKVYIEKQKDKMIEEGVRLDVIGDLSKLPWDVKEAIEDCKVATSQGKTIDLVLALNYGGRDDIRRAARAIAEDCIQGKLTTEQLSESIFSQYLDTAKWEDPSLLIRTSGEQRLSNFLLWQISYAEVYITNVLWPDFDEKELLKAVISYQQREKRLGGP